MQSSTEGGGEVPRWADTIPPFPSSLLSTKSTRNGSEAHCDPPAHAGRVPNDAGGAVNVLEVGQGCCRQLRSFTERLDGNKKKKKKRGNLGEFQPPG
jgi:hypothetical protein